MPVVVTAPVDPSVASSPTKQDRLVARIRSELGDFAQPFRTTYRGDGATDLFDLPATNVTGLTVTVINNGSMTTLVEGADYSIDSRDGFLDLVTPPADGVTLMVEGQSTGLFTDAELTQYLNDALAQHTYGMTTRVRYRSSDGFIRYREDPVTVETLPVVEEVLVAILATIEALWALSTDASTDVDVSTAEGTFLPRSQRYAQIRSQIDVLTEKYKSLSQQLNVGLYRIEVTNLRRVSRQTGRLVPLYVDREWDDYTYPERIIPPIDSRYSENDRTGADPITPEDTGVEVVDLQFVAGDSFSFEVDFGFNLTGSTVLSGITSVANYYGDRVNYFTVTVTDAATGKVTLSLTPYQTSRLGSGASYDVQVTDASGNVTTYVRGRLFIEGQITPSGTVPPSSPYDINPWYIPGWTAQ